MRIGELFAGYGGLGMAVKDVWPDAEVAWVSEFDKGPSKVLAHRFPDVPNLGDITKIDWTQVPPVDIITGGSPCQDLSHAGKRQGMTDGTRSNLWVAMREAIAQLRPSLVVWENVRGALSASADSAVESCAGCVGDGSGNVLRALGRVLGDLSELGYDAAWCGLRAADVGAAHGRFRVFVLAWDAAADADSLGLQRAGQARGRGAGSADDRGADVKVLPTPTTRDHKDHTIRREPHRPDDTDTLARALTDVPCALLPTPRATDGTKGGPNQRGSKGDLMLPSAVNLLPTPAVNDMGAAYTPETWDAWTAKMQAKHGNGNGHGKSLNIEAQRLLPTPMVGSTNPAAHGQISGDYRAKMAEALGQWGDYAAAIQRWEHVIGRPAPEPTQMSAKGNPQLSARFAEWLMGVPDGWITDVPGVTRNEALKMAGNGVVPQQGAAALRWLLGQIGAHA